MERKRRKHDAELVLAQPNANEVRVTSGGKLRHYCAYVLKLLEGPGRLSAAGGDVLRVSQDPAQHLRTDVW